jgi:hypothetical protein
MFFTPAEVKPIDNIEVWKTPQEDSCVGHVLAVYVAPFKQW